MLINYTPEQQSAVDKAIAATSKTADGFLSYAWSDRIVQRGSQTLAVFGHMARVLLDAPDATDDLGNRFEYVPLVVDGRMLEEVPEEGRDGMAYLMRMTHRRGEPIDSAWSVAYLNAGWIRTVELAATNAEIVENITQEAARGETPLTGGRAGWA
jgi:hypothetical protein